MFNSKVKYLTWQPFLLTSIIFFEHTQFIKNSEMQRSRRFTVRKVSNSAEFDDEVKLEVLINPSTFMKQPEFQKFLLPCIIAAHNKSTDDAYHQLKPVQRIKEASDVLEKKLGLEFCQEIVENADNRFLKTQQVAKRKLCRAPKMKRDKMKRNIEN